MFNNIEWAVYIDLKFNHKRLENVVMLVTMLNPQV